MRPLDHGVDAADASIATISFLISGAIVVAAVVSYLWWRRREMRRVASLK